MRTIGVVATIVFFIGATLLCLSIAAPGAAAIAAFRTLPALGLQLPDFRAYAGGAQVTMGRIAAGFALEDLFRVTTLTTTVLSVVVGAAWGAVVLATPRASRRWHGRAALGCMIVLIGVAAFSQSGESALTATLHDYRTLARLGDRPRAEASKAEFDALHRRAETERKLQLGAALAAIALAAWSLAPGGRSPER